MDVLSSRILLRPADLDRSRRFYRDVLGLAIYREFGPADDPGVVFFLGQGLLEVSGRAAGPPGRSVMIWIQVRDVNAEHGRLAAAGVRIIREPVVEPWGLTEMWIEDPDGIRIVLVEVPAGHPLRRDPRSALLGPLAPPASIGRVRARRPDSTCYPVSPTRPETRRVRNPAPARETAWMSHRCRKSDIGGPSLSFQGRVSAAAMDTVVTAGAPGA